MLDARHLSCGGVLVTLLFVAFPGCTLDGRVLLEGHAGAASSSGGLNGSGGTRGSGSGANGAGGSGGGTAEAGVDSSADDGGGSAGHSARGGAGGMSGSAGSAGSGGIASATGSGGSAGAGGGTGGTAGDGSCEDVDVSAAGCGENLIRNARFDRDTTGWLAEPALQQHWDPRDGKGANSSGALSIINVNWIDAGGAVLTTVGSRQCVDVTGDQIYFVGARLFVPGRQGEAHASINLWAYADPGCQGTFLGATTPAFVNVVDSCQQVGAAVESSPATRSFLIRLTAIKLVTQTSLEVLFDDVVVRTDPQHLDPIRMW